MLTAQEQCACSWRCKKNERGLPDHGQEHCQGSSFEGRWWMCKLGCMLSVQNQAYAFHFNVLWSIQVDCHGTEDLRQDSGGNNKNELPLFRCKWLVQLRYGQCQSCRPAGTPFGGEYRCWLWTLMWWTKTFLNRLAWHQCCTKNIRRQLHWAFLMRRRTGARGMGTGHLPTMPPYL